MSSIGDRTLTAFFGEIEKISAWNGLGAMGALGGAGMAGGALLGAGRGALRSYHEAKDQGATTGQAISSGVGGALHGAAHGAALGGALGAAGGAGAALISPEKAEAARLALSKTRVPFLGSGARFGQRQVHGLTGWRPGELGPRDSLAQIGMGSSLREGAVHAAQKELEAAQQAGTSAKRTLGDRVLGRSGVEGAQARLEGAKKSLEAADEVERRGLTSIPGYVSGLRRDPVGTVRAAVGNELRGSPSALALQVGLPAASMGAELMHKEDPNHPDEGRLHRAARHGVTAAGGLLLSPLPFGTQTLLTETGHALAKRKQPQGTVMPSIPHDLTADSGQAVPGERVVSERAAGSLGEGSPS